MKTRTELQQLTRDVRDYIADCRKLRAYLSPEYHPTESGAVKLVYHRKGDEKFIRDTFRDLISRETTGA